MVEQNDPVGRYAALVRSQAAESEAERDLIRLERSLNHHRQTDALANPASDWLEIAGSRAAVEVLGRFVAAAQERLADQRARTEAARQEYEQWSHDE